jgi:HEAT repeat protein
MPGCASYFDNVLTNKQAPWGATFHAAPDPLHEIQNNPDGDARAWALARLDEPARPGGSQKEQDAVLTLLSRQATQDKLVPCRLAAIGKLSEFRDPRAVQILEEAYYQAGSQGIAPEHASVIRSQTLRALGRTGNPAAVDLLVKVVREPAVEGPSADKQRRLDERIAAARALGSFNHPGANTVLVGLLREEKDVALRYRAHESLQQATGRDYPADPAVWADYLEGKDPDGGRARTPGFVDKVIRLISWEER